jgi:hypothetical protein
MRIVANHICAIEALAAASADCLDHAMLRSSYENAINLTGTPHSSENLTDGFTALVTENEDLILECDASIVTDGKGHAFWGAHHHSWTVACWHHISYMLCHLEDLRKGLQ